MSEINSILASSNKIVYSSVNSVSDGVNNFLNSFKLVHTTTITRTIKGEDNNRMPLSINDLAGHTLIYHIHGTVDKDIADCISMYNFSNGGKNTATIIPANQHSKIDYIDIVWINTLNSYIYIRPYDPDFNPLDVVYTVKFTVDVYDLY